MAPGGVATAGHAGALPVSAPGSRAAEREAAVGQTSAMGLQKVAIDTPRLFVRSRRCRNTRVGLSWRMAPTSDTRKISERVAPAQNPR